ncbi:MAG: hypothetical protein SPL13_01275 [Clostridia bacterium]|nr:hypothetical protein [Clostridia bacterium]
MEENEKGMGLGELLNRAFVAIKRNIILVLAIILIFAAGGFVMANLRKPLYTASERVSYQAGSDDASDVTSAYFQTVVGFCSSGSVIDRANFYYDYYVNHGYQNVASLLEDIKNATEGDDLYYDESKIAATKWITRDKVGVIASNGNEESYIITIRYTDTTVNAAYDKVKIVLTAIENEVNRTDARGEGLYFRVHITISDYGYMGASSDWSKSRIITIATVIGVIVALLAVYFINLSDRSIKEKREIERITGTSLLAFIEDQEA